MTTHSHGNATNHPSRAGLTWRHLYWPLAGAALLLPLLAMQVTEEVDWSGADIVLMGALLLGVGGTFELAARMSDDLSYRLGVSGALAAGFLLWVNGAAGIIGTEDNSANLIYGGVLAIALIGVFVDSRPSARDVTGDGGRGSRANRRVAGRRGRRPRRLRQRPDGTARHQRLLCRAVGCVGTHVPTGSGHSRHVWRVTP